MSQNIRFLTADEKKTSLGKHPRLDEPIEDDPSAFISVLINGDCFQVQPLDYSSNIRRMLMVSARKVSGQICLQ